MTSEDGLAPDVQAPAMVEGRYATAFPLKHQQKDMRLALERAGQGHLQLPVASAANRLYEQVWPFSPAVMAGRCSTRVPVC